MKLHELPARTRLGILLVLALAWTFVATQCASVALSEEPPVGGADFGTVIGRVTHYQWPLSKEDGIVIQVKGLPLTYPNLDGYFTIHGVPKGEVTVNCLYKKLGGEYDWNDSRKLTITPGTTTSCNFPFPKGTP